MSRIVSSLICHRLPRWESPIPPSATLMPRLLFLSVKVITGNPGCGAPPTLRRLTFAVDFCEAKLRHGRAHRGVPNSSEAVYGQHDRGYPYGNRAVPLLLGSEPGGSEPARGRPQVRQVWKADPSRSSAE